MTETPASRQCRLNRQKGKRVSGASILLRSNALSLPLADESVDLIVTSPPYFALRSYQDGGEHYDGQLGNEATPIEFVDALVAATVEMVRVLKPSGSIFVNLGDKYAGSNRQSGGASQLRGATYSPDGTRTNDAKRGGYVPKSSIRTKSLLGIPWRYALRCIDDLDLILRAEIIWAKTNGMPESVTDRVTRKHEQWFHFTKSETYYSNIDTIREPYLQVSLKRAMPHRSNVQAHEDSVTVEMSQACHPEGKAPWSWWAIPTQPLQVPAELGIDHFAAFPTEWPRRLILGWSPSGICTECGEGRRALVKRTTTGHDNNRGARALGRDVAGNSKTDLREAMRLKMANPDHIIGEKCLCSTPTAPTAPAVVLDPFGGTGTTAAVAKALGRAGISVDLSADYLRLADWRCNGDGYSTIYSKIHDTEKATKPMAGQETLDL